MQRWLSRLLLWVKTRCGHCSYCLLSSGLSYSRSSRSRGPRLERSGLKMCKYCRNQTSQWSRSRYLPSVFFCAPTGKKNPKGFLLETSIQSLSRLGRLSYLWNRSFVNNLQQKRHQWAVKGSQNQLFYFLFPLGEIQLNKCRCSACRGRSQRLGCALLWR